MPRVAAIGPATATALGGRRPRSGGGDAGGPPAQSCRGRRPRPARRGRGCADGAAEALDADCRARSIARVELQPPEPPAATSRAHVGVAPRRALRGDRRAPCRSVAIGPQTAGCGIAAGHRLVADGIVAAVRSAIRAASTAADRTLDGAGVHHLPHRLRAAGRLRRDLSRRDQADRARDRRSSTSRTASGPGGPAGRARAGEHAARTCRSACTSRWSIRESAATGVRSRCGRRGPALRRPGQRAAAPRCRAHADRRGPRARQPRLRPRNGLADVPRARSVLPGSGASLASASRSASSGRRSTPRRSSGSNCRSPRSWMASSTPRCSTSTASGTSPST